MGFLLWARSFSPPHPQDPPATMNNIASQFHWNWFDGVAACGFLFLLAKTLNSHRDRIYNPSLISKYWEAFEKMEGVKRGSAASACLDFLRVGDWEKVKEPERVEDVLDFFEDLGFNLKHKQLSIQ